MEKQGEWRNFVAGAAIGVGVGVASEVVIPAGAVAAVAVPLGFESVGGAAETAMGTNTIDWLHDHEYNNDQQSIHSIEEAKDKGARNAMTPLLNYADDLHMTPHEVRDLTWQAQSVYQAGGSKSDTDDARGW
ncbi:hypothetical protein ACIBO9_18590 [Streptomyces prunicolor]|uniref:hypothetical protein n=1 Tax=Streptomyces prunicolor TaxID=67348 RepID=UPI0037D671B0